MVQKWKTVTESYNTGFIDNSNEIQHCYLVAAINKVEKATSTVYKENKFKPCSMYKQLLNLFISWCEWVLRQAKSGPRQAKGTTVQLLTQRTSLNSSFFFSSPVQAI